VSNINYTRINENFPVAGQDNDTQVFRDNFDTIKTSLRVAQEEITALEDPATGAARLNRDNDFNRNTIQNAVLQNNIEKTTSSIEVPIEGATVNTATIDFENGHYQLFRVTESTVIFDFLNFPINTGVGKVTVEFTSSNGLTRTILFSDQPDNFRIKKSPGFPDVLQVTSQTDPIIVEIWRRDASTIYMKYVGLHREDALPPRNIWSEVKIKTDNYTFTEADHGKTFIIESGNSINLTLGTGLTTLSQGWFVKVITNNQRVGLTTPGTENDELSGIRPKLYSTNGDAAGNYEIFDLSTVNYDCIDIYRKNSLSFIVLGNNIAQEE